MQANKDKPYSCEIKPNTLVYLDSALTGKLTQKDIDSTALPLFFATTLANINSICKFSDQLLSLKIGSDDGLNELFTVSKNDTTKIFTLYNNPTLVTEITSYLSVLQSVVPTYVSSVISYLRVNPGIRFNALSINQSRYVQIAYASSPSTFTFDHFSDLDLYSYFSSASIENTMFMAPFLPKTKLCELFRKIKISSGETITYNPAKVGLLTRSIIPKLGVRVRLLAKGERNVAREIDLDFLGSDDEC